MNEPRGDNRVVLLQLGGDRAHVTFELFDETGIRAFRCTADTRFPPGLSRQKECPNSCALLHEISLCRRIHDFVPAIRDWIVPLPAQKSLRVLYQYNVQLLLA